LEGSLYPSAGQAQVRRTGSTRTLAPAKLHKSARLLRTQARHAGDLGRPVAWLALILARLDGLAQLGERVKGTSGNTGRVAAVLAASADFGSGRRARPGRQVTAVLLDVSERTVERHWRLLERLGVAARTADGRWLAAGERADVYAAAGERNRWRDRQEWRLVVPDWAAALDEDTVNAYTHRARELLMSIAYGKPVDNSGAADLVVRRRVAPSTGGQGVRTWLPVRRGQSLRPDGRKEQKGAASPHSSTGPGRRKARPAPSPGVALARQIADSGRFGWLRGTPTFMVAAVVRRLSGWTVADVVDEVDQRMRLLDFTYSEVRAPAAFLRWLLADADPARPPRQLAHAAQAAARDANRDSRRPDSGQDGPAGVRISDAARVTAARAAARAAAAGAGRTRGRRPAGAQRPGERPYGTERLAAAAAAVEALGVVCVVCGAGGADYRVTPSVVAMCDPCWEPVRVAIGG
jgi:hypothetical protein